MENNRQAEILGAQLDRIIGFYEQADSKAQVVFAVGAGMLALLGSNAPPLRSFRWPMLFTAIPVVLIALSFWHLYRQLFPRLEGGAGSLIYFREVARRPEAEYASAFKAQTEDAYVADLLGQVWITSEILRRKYDHLKSAFVLMALAVFPWALSLAMFASGNTESNTLLQQ